jgi:hypothetical protein
VMLGMLEFDKMLMIEGCVPSNSQVVSVLWRFEML